ncbi:PH domain-containing protein [Patescibacteria group bacterium]|nr:PH domain-containing protein [Patescibacteria group bacterium]
MVDREYVQSQLAKIGFGEGRFNRAEIRELENILLPDEIIYECVNGYYEGGVALLVATDIRVLLIDKKPMGFLNVDDVRFDMISDIDYSHRIIGAQININCGMRNLLFKSYNQPRLRKAIGHIQQRMSEIKKELTLHATVQKKHLEDINKQLQMYLLAQQQHLERQLNDGQVQQPPRPNPQLADYLFAQRLLEEFQERTGKRVELTPEPLPIPPQKKTATIASAPLPDASEQRLLEEMVEAGRMEVFGGSDKITHFASNDSSLSLQATSGDDSVDSGLDVSPIKIAYAKLPYLLRHRRYNTQNLI